MADKIEYDVPKIGQANSKICWLACYQMLYGWNGLAPKKAVERAIKAGLSTSSGLMSKDWHRARKAMGLTSYRVSYLKGYDGMVWVLRKHGPVWCAGDFLQGSGHAVVISALDLRTKTLRINDPYEIYKYGGYNYLTHDGWCKKVKDLPFACQVWPRNGNSPLKRLGGSLALPSDS